MAEPESVPVRDLEVADRIARAESSDTSRDLPTPDSPATNAIEG